MRRERRRGEEGKSGREEERKRGEGERGEGRGERGEGRGERGKGRGEWGKLRNDARQRRAAHLAIKLSARARVRKKVKK